MSIHKCPLCKQDVSQKLYEEITGVWQEKEKQMSILKAKEKSLLTKEKQLKAKFESERKLIAKQEAKKYEKQIEKQNIQFKKERDLIKKDKARLEIDFKRKIANASAETNRILKEERQKIKESKKTLKQQFAIAAKEKINKENLKIQKEKRLQQNRYDQLNKQFSSMQTKSMAELTKASLKIKSLEEQIKKNETPQVLGLLEEVVFLDKLKEKFPDDKFDHTGKGGDIVHSVILKDKIIGIIVYELKKVSKFNLSHIAQAYEAKQQRHADYALLVTNAKRNKEDMGFSVQKGVMVIHPAGALVLISILREHLFSISRLKLSKEKRNQTIDAILEYVQSPVFKNGVENIIADTIDLYQNLKKEVKDHISTWENRIDKYRNIHHQAHTIESKVINLLVTDGKSKLEVMEQEIKAIALPQKID